MRLGVRRLSSGCSFEPHGTAHLTCIQPLTSTQTSYAIHARQFDGILENASQEAVYAAAAADAADAALAGVNATLLCYGQTGAGKTYTMCGGARDYQRRGVIPRALHHVFREIDRRPDRTYRCGCGGGGGGGAVLCGVAALCVLECSQRCSVAVRRVCGAARAARAAWV